MYNVESSNPGDANLAALFQQQEDADADLIVIAFQEMKPAKAEEWQQSIENHLNGEDYQLIAKRSLSEIMMVSYALPSMAGKMSNVAFEDLKVEAAKSKGSMVMRFSFNGKDVAIVGSHFAPHVIHNDQRIFEYNRVIGTPLFDDKKKLLDHDLVFWIGDLNFRLDDSISIDQVNEAIIKQQEEQLYNHLKSYDQLTNAIKQKEAFERFHEKSIDFLPSYKFFVNTNDYDLSRKPAWTDRILHNVISKEASLEQWTYVMHRDYQMSDHKPVTAQFKVTL